MTDQSLDAARIISDLHRSAIEARDEVVRLRAVCNEWGDNYQTWVGGTWAAETERDRLLSILTGEVRHIYAGRCPDDLEGWDSRDPECPACKIMIDVEERR